MRPALLLGCLVLLACGSRQTTVFRPHSAVDLPGPPIAVEAVDVLEGDARYLDGARPVGTLGVLAGHEAEGRCVAAKNGGTHILHRARTSRVSELTQTSRTTVRVDHDDADTYEVVRVERPAWASLPAPLRPAGPETFPTPLWNSDPALWDCAARH